MSTLLNLRKPTPEALVQTSNDEGFLVRGLAPHQVFSLYQRHTGELSELFERVMVNVRTNGTAGGEDIESVVLALLSEAPVIVSELIVVASGGSTDAADLFDSAMEVARELPFPVQVDAIAKISELTFTSDMPPGKLLALVVGLLEKVTGALKLGSQAT